MGEVTHYCLLRLEREDPSAFFLLPDIHNPILHEFNTCLIPDQLDNLLHSGKKHQPKPTTKLKLKIYQVKETHWPNAQSDKPKS